MEPSTRRASHVTSAEVPPTEVAPPLRVPAASAFRRTLRFAATAALAAAVFGAALAPAPAARAQEKPQPLAPGEVQKVRGIMEWRRAVWAMDKSGYIRASQDLFVARQLQEQARRPDHTTNFVLALVIGLGGDSSAALAFYEPARAIAGGFPGNLLVEEVIHAADLRSDDRAGNLAAAELLDRYFVALASYERTAPYHAELEFLGFTQRGTRNFRAERFDRAIADFDRAIEIAKASKRSVAPELTRMLALCHQRVSQGDEAERLIHDALRGDPGEPSHYHVIGQLKADGKFFDQAAVWYERAARRKPDYPEPHVKLAYLAGESATPDVWRLRSSLERYQILMEVELGRDLSAPPQAGAVVPDRERSARINILSGNGVYWKARAERAADAGDIATAKKCWGRSVESFRRVLEIEPNCVRAINATIQLLHLLEAPDADLEVEKLKQHLKDLNDMKPGLGRPYGDTFC